MLNTQTRLTLRGIKLQSDGSYKANLFGVLGNPKSDTPTEIAPTWVKIPGNTDAARAAVLLGSKDEIVSHTFPKTRSSLTMLYHHLRWGNAAMVTLNKDTSPRAKTQSSMFFIDRPQETGVVLDGENNAYYLRELFATALQAAAPKSLAPSAPGD